MGPNDRRARIECVGGRVHQHGTDSRIWRPINTGAPGPPAGGRSKNSGRGPDSRSTVAWPALMTYDEVAEALRCSRRTIERRVAAGELQIVRHGRRVLVAQASVRAFVARHTCRHAQDADHVIPSTRISEGRLWDE